MFAFFVVSQKEEAFEQSPLGLTTLGSPQHSSSFTYFGGKNIDGTATKDAAMAPSYYSTPPRNDQKQIEQQEEQKHTPLVHTVSTYRKQQQQQRRLAIKVSLSLMLFNSIIIYLLFRIMFTKMYILR